MVLMADILVFGAHPDDAEFGMGASMVKFVRSGASVALCVLTRGESGTFGTPEQREGEMKAAAAMLGGELEILSYRDCQVFDTFEARVRLAEVVRRFRPRIVFSPYHTNPSYHKDGAAHPDHNATGTDRAFGAALRAVCRPEGSEGRAVERRAPVVLHGAAHPHAEPCSTTSVAYMDEWRTIASCHTSQLSLRDGKVLDNLRRFREAYGNLLGVECAEGFSPRSRSFSTWAFHEGIRPARRGRQLCGPGAVRPASSAASGAVPQRSV